MEEQIHRGRGATFRPANRFARQITGKYYAEGVDDFTEPSPKTSFIAEYPQKIISKNNSPDVPFNYSVNPYQGCEHGCVYCYARQTHEYWGYSAGLDFEAKIIVKHNAPQLLEQAFLNPRWQVEPIMFSGNTDCYQPAERQFKLTRELLKVCLKYRNPVSIITKNSLILRDLDILQDLARFRLVKVMVSITTLNETLRRQLEPRTATARKRLTIVERLNGAAVPAGVMIAPVIPGLNMSEVPALVQAAAAAGALAVNHTVLRLNGAIAHIFCNWLQAVYPQRANKILAQVETMHDGKVSDSRFVKRMTGAGQVAEMIGQMVAVARDKHMPHREFPAFDTRHFRRGGMYTIW